MPAQISQSSGNVLFLILIAIILFAALSYAVTSSSRSSQTDASPEKLQLIASQIEQYGSLLSSTIMRLQTINGCTETQINFAGGNGASYSNTNAPSNGLCDVFGQNGGFLPQPTSLSSEYLKCYGCDAYTASLMPYHGGIYYYVSANVTGSSAQDLVIVIPFVTAELCTILNKKLNDAPPPMNFLDNKFDYAASLFGTSGYNSTSNNGPTISTSSGCGYRTSRGYYNYYRVLIER